MALTELIIQIIGFTSIFSSIVIAAWKISGKLTGSKGIAEEAHRLAVDAVRRVERAEDDARETHQLLFEKLEEIKDLVRKSCN